MEKKINTIAISRTDNIGDVVLALPVAGLVRKYYPEAEIIFIGRTYTRAVIETSVFVDRFVDREAIIADPLLLNDLHIDAIVFIFPDRPLAKLARRASIPMRIGSFRKLQHLWNCTHWVNFTRRGSDLHESLLNFKLLKPLSIPSNIDKKDIPALYGMENIQPLPARLRKLLVEDRFNLIIHPKSHGHGKEWPPEKYLALCKILAPANFNIIFTGTDKERDFIQQHFRELLEQKVFVHNAAGEMNLDELVSFISEADGLLASGTGPLHVAAALGVLSVGFFPPMAPVFSQRWENLGRHAFHFELDHCDYQHECRKGVSCRCIAQIEVNDVAALLLNEASGKQFTIA